MEKRYQVFISSTYTDLKEERSKVIQKIMELDCIPAGMEIFPAVDEEQFNFIKRIIDDCDYYLLIIGGRYGSVSDTGISFTEMEYDYAIEKGLKVLAFIHSDPALIPFGKSEKDDLSRQKLEEFKKKVSKGRIIKQWNDVADLPSLVLSSLSLTIRTYPAIGWVRANQLPSSNFTEEFAVLSKENRSLKEELEKHTQKLKPKIDVFANDLNEIHFSIKKIRGWDLCEPIDEDSIKEYRKKLPENYVIDYNKSIEDNIELAKQYNKEIKLYKNRGKEIIFKVVNNGTVKAKVLHVDILASTGLKLIDESEIPKIRPEWPEKILQHPFNMAITNIINRMPRMPSYFNNSQHYPAFRLPSVILNNNEKWQSLKENKLFLFKQDLLHTRSSVFEKIIITADEPGEYELAISCICEEFPEPEIATMKVYVKEE